MCINLGDAYVDIIQLETVSESDENVQKIISFMALNK